jgi:hypothetical protein
LHLIEFHGNYTPLWDNNYEKYRNVKHVTAASNAKNPPTNPRSNQMDNRILPSSLLKGFLLLMFGASCLLFSSGCRSLRSRAAEEPDEVRSELVLLNVTEASGWVAYHCSPSQDPEMEDYRVVVIRQQTGAIIYDSQIPLASDLCTHGFEMAPDDPRLLSLAQNVDSSIIEPLEAFRRSQSEANNASESETDTTTNSSNEPSAGVASEHNMRNVRTAAPSAYTSTVAAQENASEESPYRMTSIENGIVHMVLKDSGSLNQGDRLFVRNPQQIISIPGTGEQVLVSKGEVVGLIEVVSSEGLIASAKRITGEIPGNGHLEKAK